MTRNEPERAPKRCIQLVWGYAFRSVLRPPDGADDQVARVLPGYSWTDFAEHIPPDSDWWKLERGPMTRFMVFDEDSLAAVELDTQAKPDYDLLNTVFVSINSFEDRVLDFAARYGPLGQRESFHADDGTRYEGERFERWHDQMRLLFAAHTLRQWIPANERERQRRSHFKCHELPHEWLDSPFSADRVLKVGLPSLPGTEPIYRLLKLDEEQFCIAKLHQPESAAIHLCERLLRAVRAGYRPRLVQQVDVGDTPNLEPETLLDLLWHRLLYDAKAWERYRHCPGCSLWFDPRERASGEKRTKASYQNRNYCEDACRHKDKYSRRKKAFELIKGGVPPEEVAAHPELGITLKTAIRMRDDPPIDLKRKPEDALTETSRR